MNNLALIYESSGRLEQAHTLLEQAIQIDPSSDAVYLNLAGYYARQHRVLEALENYKRAAAVNSQSALPLIEIGRIYLERGQTDRALDQLNAALDLDPHSLDAYALLAALYDKSGRKKEADAAREESKRIKPS